MFERLNEKKKLLFEETSFFFFFFLNFPKIKSNTRSRSVQIWNLSLQASITVEILPRRNTLNLLRYDNSLVYLKNNFSANAATINTAITRTFFRCIIVLANSLKFFAAIKELTFLKKKMKLFSSSRI